MILPATYRAGAATVADHMRLALGSQPYHRAQRPCRPAAHELRRRLLPRRRTRRQSLIAIADANLYESKRWGGDTVTASRETSRRSTSTASGFSTLDALVNAVDNKDHYTRKPFGARGRARPAIVESLGFSKEKQEMLRVAALLHDVGKIGLPDRILRKPGPLTPRKRTRCGSTRCSAASWSLSTCPGKDEVREAVLHHHERWDGSGYPAGLKRPRHPTAGPHPGGGRRLFGHDHRPSVSRGPGLETAIEELKKGSGKQFDPEVVNVFMTCFHPRTRARRRKRNPSPRADRQSRRADARRVFVSSAGMPASAYLLLVGLAPELVVGLRVLAGRAIFGASGPSWT